MQRQKREASLKVMRCIGDDVAQRRMRQRPDGVPSTGAVTRERNRAYLAQREVITILAVGQGNGRWSVSANEAKKGHSAGTLSDRRSPVRVRECSRMSTSCG